MSMSPQQPSPQRAQHSAAPKLTISRGVKAQPEWIVIFGPPGVGKTTLAANSPEPVFIDLEGGSAQLDVARIEGVNTWDEFIAALRALVTEPHSFQTLVIDTLDKAEWLCWQKVCASASGGKDGKVFKSLEDFGFGKGYIAAYEEFRRLINVLQELRTKRSVRTIILAHAKLGKVPNTSGGPDYDRWELKVDKKVGGVFFEAADAVLYAHRDVAVAKKDGERARAYGDKRQIGTEETTAYMAKNRFGLPAIMDLSWEVLADAIGKGNSPAMLLASIRKRAVGLTDPKMRARLDKGLAEHGTNFAKLIEIDSWLAANLTANPPDNTAPSAESNDPASTNTSATTEPSE